MPLLSPDFDERLRTLTTDEARASEMEHAIRDEIHVKLEEDRAGPGGGQAEAACGIPAGRGPGTDARRGPRASSGDYSAGASASTSSCCDELGFVPLDRTGGELLFNVLSERHGRRSVVITTNLSFSEWPRVFGGDEKLTAALLDRLAEAATIITTRGKELPHAQPEGPARLDEGWAGDGEGRPTAPRAGAASPLGAPDERTRREGSATADAFTIVQSGLSLIPRDDLNQWIGVGQFQNAKVGQFLVARISQRRELAGHKGLVCVGTPGDFSWSATTNSSQL